MLNEDIYALILKKVVDLEQSLFDKVKNWKTKEIVYQASGQFKLNNEWPISASKQEKIILHAKIVYRGTRIKFWTISYADKYYNRWEIVSKFECLYVSPKINTF